ncbi:protein-tyrosine phosphatase-like protein [Spinellus fusiger]|nr:protein-tyrosine phosphatase-like protein [Spinellus fusiger]
MGISTMYKYLAITCQREILSVLRLFVDPCRYPILVHCSHGKDRTAIVIGLLLSIAGVSHDKIVEDYKYTQTALAEVYSELLDNIKGAGLSDEFADADPKNMDMLLSYLESTFGSIKDYLNAICFNEKEQEAIRANFVEKG